MPDKGHKMTDDMIAELEQKLHNLYTKADSDLQKKAASRLKKYNDTVKVKEKTLNKDAFEAWKKNQAYMLSNQKNLIDTIAEDLVKTDQIALDIINNHTPSAYALNYNYGTYQIEDAGKINTSFALYNHDTVELLALYDDSSLLPEPKNLDIPKDLQWNKKHLSQAISQGVLQGESIDKIAKRLSAAVGMDENGAIRNARTMMTAAQNGGRVDAYLRGKAMGIELQQKWQATEDSRTRKSHRAIDGEVIEVGEEFSNHCHFPGDPVGPGREVYNCRCTLLPLVNGIKNFENPMVTASEEESHYIANGKDISGTWVRRSDLFDFEIEDVMNAQGFDGKPRIVSADEFDKLVKQANDGKGFIAQRSYSAPDQKILETYRQQLYEGKWYVDCSTGGAQYGQGMYCAADYTGTLTDGIKAEMKHYADINYDKVFDTAYDQAVQHALDNKLDIPTKDEFKKMFTGGSYTETFTLDPSAKIITYDDIYKLKANENVKSIFNKFIDESDFNDIEKAIGKREYGSATIEEKQLAKAFEKENIDEYDKILEKLNPVIEKAEKHYDEIKDLDLGAYAAMKGYDAINAVGHGSSSSYTVILNRTKLIVKAPDKKYLKKGFEDWLEDQADSQITAKFGSKAMSVVYQELKDLKGSKIGNDFYYKILQPAGKPGKVWKEYINGTLDAANTKKIDDYLLKHFDLNTGKLDDVIKATDKVDDISDAAKAAESKLNIKKGSPMSTKDADNYKVNPLYNVNDAATKKNCQTCTFVYECRKQGYDIVALPKMVDSNNLPLKDFKAIGEKQQELAKNQSLGWINKKTGKAPEIEFGNSIDYVMTKNEWMTELEKHIGNNGERYTLSVRWKSGKGHVVNIDRDKNGKLRIIDNQKGFGEKNTWTDKELEDYFTNKHVKNIKAIYRVDDCVPNPEYFNTIVIDAKKMKPYAHFNTLSIDDQAVIAKKAMAKNIDTEAYYNKWRFGMIDDSDLDKLFKVKIDPTDGADKSLILDTYGKKSLNKVYIGLKDEFGSTVANDFYYKVMQPIGPASGTWKKYLAGELDDISTKKIDDYLLKYLPGKGKADDIAKGVKTADKASDVTKASKTISSTKKADNGGFVTSEALDVEAFKNKSANAVWKELNANKMGGGKFWTDITNIGKTKGVKPAEVWKKYLAGELDSKDIDTIEKHLAKLYSKKADDVKDITNDALEAAKKKYNVNKLDDAVEKIINDPDAFEELYQYASANLNFDAPAELAKKYLKGEVDIPELDKHLKKQVNKTVNKVATENKTFDADLVKSKAVSSFYSEWKKEGNTALVGQWWKIIGDIGKNYGLEKKQSKVWELYKTGQLKDDEVKKIEDFLTKNYFNKNTTEAVIDYSKVAGEEIYNILSNLNDWSDMAILPPKDYSKIITTFKGNKAKVEEAIEEAKKIKALKDKSVKESILSATKKTTAAKSDELIKAEKKLEKAQDELAKLPNPTYSGIWKDDVTLADYETKKGTIKAKKIWYEEEIDKLENDPSYKSWLSDEDKQYKIWDLQHHLDDLEDFETAGKEYAKVQKAVREAQDEVNKLSPSQFSKNYSQERKDAALYIRGSSSKIREEANKHFAAQSEKEFKAAKKIESDAIKEYTSSYHKFNEPLRGIEYGTSKVKGVGNVDLNAGYANNGKKLNAMTDYLEKTNWSEDIWLQRGCGWGGMDNFLQVDMSLLQNGTEEKLRQALLGKTVTEYGFMSAGTGRGAGFSGNIIFNIFLPKGAKASYAEVYSYYKNGSEIETIIQQGVQFTVTRIDKSGGTWFIDLELSGYLPPQRYTP